MKTLMYHPLISIIVPVYNVEPFIEECLTSVANQTYNNYEVILVNDGCTDNTITIVEQFIHNKSDVFKLFHKENGGLSDARNFGINKAQGEFLLFVDSDDYIAANTLDTAANAVADSGSDIICFALAEVTEQKEKIRYIPANAKEILGTFTLSDSKDLISSSLPNACNKLIKKELFTQNDIQFPVGLWYEDLATNPKLFYFANSITFIDDELYFYRQRDGAITKTFSLKVMDIYQILANLVSFFKSHNYENAKTDINTWYINLTIITMARLALNNETSARTEALQSISKEIKQQFPSRSAIYLQAFSKPRYKVFALLIRLGLIKLVDKIIKQLVNKKIITI